MERRDDLRELPNRDGHKCFGCSPSNAYGLQMKFFTDEKSLFSWVTVPGHLCGWDNLVHGGVIAAILDETMGWTAISFLKKFALTLAMTVEFHKSVPIGEEIWVKGSVLSVRGKREASVEGCLYKGENTLCAKSTAKFEIFTTEAIVRLGVMKEEDIKQFNFLIEP